MASKRCSLFHTCQVEAQPKPVDEKLAVNSPAYYRVSYVSEISVFND